MVLTLWCFLGWGPIQVVLPFTNSVQSLSLKVTGYQYPFLCWTVYTTPSFIGIDPPIKNHCNKLFQGVDGASVGRLHVVKETRVLHATWSFNVRNNIRTMDYLPDLLQTKEQPTPNAPLGSHLAEIRLLFKRGVSYWHIFLRFLNCREAPSSIFSSGRHSEDWWGPSLIIYENVWPGR